MNLPVQTAAAMSPLFNVFPPEQAMAQLVVKDTPSRAVAEQVEAVLMDPALSRPVLQSAVWLYADDLDRSHVVSQGIDDSTGSFWHGIMHRREGDFPNSHYWFNKVGDHPAFARIGDYDPHEFVTAVESKYQSDPADLIAIQRREWEELFRWCSEQGEES